MSRTERREWARLRLRQLGYRVDDAVARLCRPIDAVWSLRAELAVAGCVVGGWASVTLAVARIGAASIVWPLSIGLALLSLCGWTPLRHLVTVGLYALTQKEGRRG